MDNNIVLMYNKGTKYLENNKPDKALKMFKKVVKAYPCKEAYTNGGNCYRLLDQDKLMFEWYYKALDPGIPFLSKESRTHLHAMNNLGLSYYTYGDDEKAIEYYTKCVTEKPDFWEAWWNCSTATLRQASSGDESKFPKAWEMYNARFLKEAAQIKLKNRRENLLFWDGKSEGNAIVVLAEQGVGDAIMFGRYLDALAKKFKVVYVQCSTETYPLFSKFSTVTDPTDIREEDVVAVPFCSLASYNLESNEKWLKGFGGTHAFNTPGLNIGVVWSGSPTHTNDRHRSVDVNYFRRFTKYGNLYSLNPAAKVPTWVHKLPIKSWADTAAYVNGLDLIISVDTSVVHLAASMGAETWLIQPYKETDFRWGHGSSVWYPDVRIFQNNQNWEDVFDRVEACLQ